MERAQAGAFRAVADPTRRRILDLLRDAGPLRAGDIAGRFPGISRPAVSRHLRVLRHARLVRERRSGRERWYALNPAPLHWLYEGWLRRYEALWGDRLQTLRHVVEQEQARPPVRGTERRRVMRWVAPTLVVRDLRTTVEFYTGVLGFEEWFRWTPERGPASAGVVRGDVRFIFDEGAVPSSAGAGVEFYVDVGDEDIDGLAARVQARGARILQEIREMPWGDRVFTVADPDGYRLRFAKRPDPAGDEPGESRALWRTRG